MSRETSERGIFMETNDTKTPNGDSNNYKVGSEEARNLIKETAACKVVVVDLAKMLPTGFENPAECDFTGTRVVRSRKVKDNIPPEKQGNALDTDTAAKFDRDGVTIVLDGRPQVAQEIKENETQRIAREAVEREQSAADKYAKNNPETSAQGPDRD